MSIVTAKDQVLPSLPVAGAAAPMRRLPAAPPPPGMTGKDFLRILRKRMLMILIVFTIIISVVMGATGIWYFTAPSYTAKAYLAVSPPINTIIANPGTPTYTQEIIERYKRSYAALVKQPEVLNASLRDSRLQDTAWYKDNSNRAPTALEEDLDVVIIPETDMFTISMTGRSAMDLANIVNTVAEVYVTQARSGPLKMRKDEYDSLQTSRNNLSGRLSSLNQDRNTRSEAVTAGITRTYLMQAEASEVLRDLNKAKNDQKDAEDAAESWKNMSDQQALESSPEIQMEISRDPQLNSLLMEEINVNTALDNAHRRFGDLYPTVQSLQTRLDSVQKQITERKKMVARDRIAAMRQVAAMMSGRAKSSVGELQNRYNLLKNQLNDIDSSHNIIENFTNQIKDISESISKIDARMQDLELIMRAIQGDVGPVAIRSPATEPIRPSSPSWKLMLGVGLAGGLLASVALALLLELGDTSVKTPSDIVRRMDLPLLGMVPHSDDMAEEISDFRRAAQLAPHSPAAEAFRQIRTNLLFSGPAEHRRSVLVTSPAPQDGRTTFVLNLALSLAQAGRRVLVVDANFRQPAIASLFPQASPAGLSSALVGQVAWRDVVYKTDVENLSVVASGPLPPNPGDLLSSETMRNMVKEMTAEYDQVIFDGSPTTLVADSSVLATQVDGVILVVRAGVNSVGIVQRSVEQMHRVGARVLGAVLQGVRTTAGGYLRKHYESFYEYHQKPLP